MSDSRTMLTLMNYKTSGYFISLFVSAYSIVWLLTGMVHASNIERFALAAYTFVATIALSRGLEVSCGCLGVGSPQISWGHVVVNLGLMF